jgi:transcriptional regulator with GAF, ATPase, and Fis domain
VRLEHLPEHAGRAVSLPPVVETPAAVAPPPRTRRTYVRWSQSLTREDVERALRENPGNLAHAARILGMQRSQLYRELERLEIKPR